MQVLHGCAALFHCDEYHRTERIMNEPFYTTMQKEKTIEGIDGLMADQDFV
jgi:hypothetical protein